MTLSLAALSEVNVLAQVYKHARTVRHGEFGAMETNAVGIPHVGEIDSTGQQKCLPHFAERTLAPKSEFCCFIEVSITCGHIKNNIQVDSRINHHCRASEAVQSTADSIDILQVLQKLQAQ